MVSRFEVGRRVAAARIAHGMTRHQLSLRINVDPHTIGRIERGDVFQRIDVLSRISNVLEVSLNWIAFGNHPPKADREFMRLLVTDEKRRETKG